MAFSFLHKETAQEWTGRPSEERVCTKREVLSPLGEEMAPNEQLIVADGNRIRNFPVPQA
ncbi:hypothetical protein [Alicyclobacillus fastidiosus]|uniref:hypothetical protein n=1 Tax=Alicyclobacillus fastidiosus TaxID=392011 RepID=UPI0024E0BA1D|nr:hypothetical protein [Alicyclobacillus fastidiosus]